MKNIDKFKTANERINAFQSFCHDKECKNCELSKKSFNDFYKCVVYWLDLEAEEKTLPCPYCGSKDISIRESINNFWFVECNVCTAKSAQNVTKENAIVTYNRVAKAVADAKKEV